MKGVNSVLNARRVNENLNSNILRPSQTNGTGLSYKSNAVKLENKGDLPKSELASLAHQELLDNYVFNLFERIYREDVRFKILIILSRREGACLRELARNAGMSHKNLAKYLQALTEKGIIDSVPVGLRDKIYKLNANYAFLRELSQ